MEEWRKSLFFGVGGRWAVSRKELFYKSNKNKAPRKVRLPLSLFSGFFFMWN